MCPEDASENSLNPLGSSSVAHAHLLEQLELAYSFRAIISDMYGSARDSKQLSSPHLMLRDVFWRLAIFMCWKALH